MNQMELYYERKYDIMNDEEYITDEALHRIQMIDRIIKDHHQGLPTFIFDSEMYNEFILPLSLAMVMSEDDSTTINEIFRHCVHIEQVTFASVEDGVYYKDRAYILRRKLIVNELYHESSILWHLDIPGITTTDSGCIIVLISVYKNIPIAHNLLLNMNESTLRSYLMTDIRSRMQVLTTHGCCNPYIAPIMEQSLDYIVNHFRKETIDANVIPYIKHQLEGYLAKENKDQKMIEGLAVIMKSLKIIGIGTDNDNTDLTL